MKEINSPIFGKSQECDITQKIMIRSLVAQSPVEVFQVLNKKLNEKGLCLSIATLGEIENKKGEAAPCDKS